MIPLRVTAELRSPICLPDGPLALDALLAYQVALRDGHMQPARDLATFVPIEIPVQREPSGRFHLCSFAIFEIEAFERQYTLKRPCIEQFQMFGEKSLKRVQINLAANKAYRIPRVALHLRDDLLEWWCIGKQDEIASLLAGVTHLGKRRAAGLGSVSRWTVEPCESWGNGFPVVRDGYPMRTLPLNWPGLENPPTAYRTLTYPHWDHAREDLVACPQMPALPC